MKNSPEPSQALNVKWNSLKLSQDPNASYLELRNHSVVSEILTHKQNNLKTTINERSSILGSVFEVRGGRGQINSLKPPQGLKVKMK